MYTREQIDAWLGPLTDSSASSIASEARQMTRRIWSVSWQGAMWAIAADGRSLVLVAGEYGYDTAPAKGVKQWLECFKDTLSKEIRITLDELREWTGPPPSRDPVTCESCEGKCSVTCESCDGKKVVSCDECEGTGSITCDCDYEHPCGTCDENGEYKCSNCTDGTKNCPECDAIGKVVPTWKTDCGAICGVQVDRRRLAHTLRGLRDQGLTIRAASAGDRIVMCSANMQAVLMQHVSETTAVPEFEATIEKG